MVYLLPVIMLLLTLAVYVIGYQKLVSPSMLFMIPFTFSAFWLSLNVSRWSVIVNPNTFFVIVGGCLSFLLGVFIASLRIKVKKVYFKSVFSQRKQRTNQSNISNSFFWIMGAVEVVILLLCFRAIRAIVHQHGYFGSISYEIYCFRNLGQYTTESTSLGQGLEWLYQLNMASGYIWVYIIAFRLSNKTKVSIPLLTCWGVSLLTGLIRGGRQSTIQIIVAGVIYFFFFYFSKHKSKKLPLKSICKIAFLVLIITVSFQSIGTVLGRTVQADFMQYFAVYFSGGIRNLNEWLKEVHIRPELFGKMTFANLYPYLGRKFGHPEWVYVMDLPYLKGNGLNSGNIYTTFYAYIYDFGYLGAFVMPFIMGVVSEIFYKISEIAKPINEHNISLSIILYGYISYLLVFSFFSNKFYEGIVKLSFLKFIIIWVMLSFVITHVNGLKGIRGSIHGNK